jgi:death-on-curing protein
VSDWERLDLEDLIRLHDIALALDGGVPGIRDRNLVASAAAQPFSGAGDVEFYPTLEEKAAQYAIALACHHAFVDGNKRTAAIALLAFLDLHAYAFTVDAEEIVVVIQSLVEQHCDDAARAAFVAWVRAHVIPVERVTVRAPLTRRARRRGARRRRAGRSG